MVQTIFARRLTLGEDSPLYWTDPELPVGKFHTGTIFRGNTGVIGGSGAEISSVRGRDVAQRHHSVHPRVGCSELSAGHRQGGPLPAVRVARGDWSTRPA